MVSSSSNTAEAAGSSSAINGDGRKRKASTSEREDSDFKRQKPEKNNLRRIQRKHDPPKTVFVSNLSSSVTEADLKAAFPNAELVNLIYDREGKSKRFAYVQLPSEEDVNAALKRDREPLNSRPMYISKCRASLEEDKQPAFKYATDVEPNKLFVKGLPVKYTKEDVEELFKPYGCTVARIITHKSGRSKGLAYVEFPNEQMAYEAMKAKDQCQIDNHTITVAISAPPPRVDRGKEPVRHARSRLQVPLVPRVLQTASSSSNSNGNVAPKSNSDFRKMLLNKDK